MIGPGSVVVALKKGGRDIYGRPAQVPEPGKRYTVIETYEMGYGLGCTLEGMDPSPYRGYVLFRAKGKKQPGGKVARDGTWLFAEVDEEAERLLGEAASMLENTNG